MSLTKTQLSCLILTLFFAATLSAKNGAPAPAVDCSTVVLEMADCLSFVTVGGTASKPSGPCCTGLKKVLKTDAQCLCEGFKNSAQLGITLNMTKAMTLPDACHVSAPSVTNCGLSIGAAPGMSPMLAPTSSVAGAPGTGISGVEAAPSPAPTSGLGSSSSGSSALVTSMELFVVSTLLAAASLAFF